MSRLPRLIDLDPDDTGWGFFLCVAQERRTGRAGSEFLALTLQDATGQIAARIFDDVDRWAARVQAGTFVRVEGTASLHAGQLQLVLSSIRPVHPEQDRLDGFREDECILSATRPIDEMWAELNARVGAVEDARLRVLLARLLADHEAQLREWPAAQTVHHSYRGGLLEHITKMAEVGIQVARAYQANADLVLAGVVLHDIGKLQELAYEAGTAEYTRDGNLVGHIALGVLLLRETAAGINGFPDDLRAALEHLVLSHHGSRDRGSPVEPKTVEAFILASVDELDARLNQVRRAIREDAGPGEFTAWHRRLGRVLYKG
ncbi:MAG: HD domain-containing protein [Vicinamibacterales bacterium]